MNDENKTEKLAKSIQSIPKDFNPFTLVRLVEHQFSTPMTSLQGLWHSLTMSNHISCFLSYAWAAHPKIITFSKPNFTQKKKNVH